MDASRPGPNAGFREYVSTCIYVNPYGGDIVPEGLEPSQKHCVPHAELASLRTRMLAARCLSNPLCSLATMVGGYLSGIPLNSRNLGRARFNFFKEQVRLEQCGENSVLLTAFYSLRLGRQNGNNAVINTDTMTIRDLLNKVNDFDTGSFSTYYRTDTVLSFEELDRLFFDIEDHREKVQSAVQQDMYRLFNSRNVDQFFGSLERILRTAMPYTEFYQREITHRPELLSTDTETIDTVCVLDGSLCSGIIRNFSSLEEADSATIDPEKIERMKIRTEEEPLDWNLPVSNQAPLQLENGISLQRLSVDVRADGSGSKLSDYLVDSMICIPAPIQIIGLGTHGATITVDKGTYMPFATDCPPDLYPGFTLYVAHKQWAMNSMSDVRVRMVINKYSSVTHSVTDDDNGLTPHIAVRPLEFIQSEPATMTSANREKRDI